MDTRQQASDDREEPDLRLGPLELRILGRERPDSKDYWDGNWVRVRATFSSAHSRASITGSFVHLGDLEQWISELERLGKEIPGKALLGLQEPDLSATVELTKLGSGTLTVEIEVHDEESHTWAVPVDQSYLVGWVDQLRGVLRRYRIRGKP